MKLRRNDTEDVTSSVFPNNLLFYYFTSTFIQGLRMKSFQCPHTLHGAPVHREQGSSLIRIKQTELIIYPASVSVIVHK